MTLGWSSSATAQPACSINPIISPHQYSPAYGVGDGMFGGISYSGDGNRLLLLGYHRLDRPGHADLTGENPDGSREMYLYDMPTETYTQITDSFGARFDTSTTLLSKNGDWVIFESDGNLTGGQLRG